MWFSYVFIIALLGALVLQWWLIIRQSKHVQQHSTQVPDAFAEKISLAAHQKAAQYTIAKLSVARFELFFTTAVLLFWTFGGGLNVLDQFWATTIDNSVWLGVAVIISFMLIGIVIDLPFSVYRTFVIEEKFGFNKMNARLFSIDLIKGIVLNLVLLTPLIWVLLWLMQSAGSFWWFYAWAIIVAYMMFIMFIQPTVIAPLFNKFTALSDEKLKSRIENLLTRCGFANRGIFIMDGSRRSAHGNAYFTGLGNKKRIVFFDTLLKSLQAKEIEAVLAHELGHFKHNHIRKQMIVMTVLLLGAFALLGWLMQQAWFFSGLGIESQSMHMALLVYMLVLPVFTIYFQPVFSYFTRKNEFEADDFAAQQSNADDLIQALVKLYEENASTLTPDPLYSAFHDSHPPAPVRVANLTSKLATE